ncbi:hypothetical protein [Mesorhizobium sp. WSM3862]|uniref:hypothetical protein n=1 Tax=Mesorhizobium sp. WSM3862 TaxID=632858 RepID=UPI0011410708|nr:hypothetical protein [Mesorhizobium sp. WSM3862]
MSYILEDSARAVSEDSISRRQCFACGGPPSSGRGEHVVPQWLQRQFKLANQRLTLINQSLIQYRHLTVPCCVDCNTGFLSRIESAVQPIFRHGALQSITEKMVVGRWLAKILIGLLVKETSLLFDRARPESGPIVSSEFIEELHHCHFLMQSARKPTVFRCLHGDLPFSLYHFKIADGGEDCFDLSTNIFGQSVAVMAGQLGVCFVSDGGLQMEVGPLGPFNLAGSTVSRTQFRELAARVHYKAALRDATHFYLTAESPEALQVDQVRVAPYSRGFLPGTEEVRIFRDWNDEEFSYALANALRTTRSALLDEATGRCGTTLFDKEGNLAVVSFQGR